MALHKYLKITDAIIGLNAKGFQFDFCLHDNKLFCPQSKLFLNARDFEILEMHYFPADKRSHYERMVYAIDSLFHNIKGILIAGTEGNTAFPIFITKKLDEFLFKNQHFFLNDLV